MIKVSAKVTLHRTRVWSLSACGPTLCPSGQNVLDVLLVSMSPCVSGTNEALLFFWLMEITKLLDSLNYTSVGQCGW